MGKLADTIKNIWGQEIANQMNAPIMREIKVEGVLYDECVHCNQRYGLQDFHDCLGTYDALRIANGVSTNSVRMRFRKKHGIQSNQDEKLHQTAVQEMGMLSTAEYNRLRSTYLAKMNFTINPDERALQLEEELWNA